MIHLRRSRNGILWVYVQHRIVVAGCCRGACLGCAGAQTHRATPAALLASSFSDWEGPEWNHHMRSGRPLSGPYVGLLGEGQGQGALQ